MSQLVEERLISKAEMMVSMLTTVYMFLAAPLMFPKHMKELKAQWLMSVEEQLKLLPLTMVLMHAPVNTIRALLLVVVFLMWPFLQVEIAMVSIVMVHLLKLAVLLLLVVQTAQTWLP